MDICKENGAYDAKHFLCYYYYGGMIYTGLKNFERALYFYEQVTLIKTEQSELWWIEKQKWDVWYHWDNESSLNCHEGQIESCVASVKYKQADYFRS